jgi:hypothetical protein
MKNLMSFKLFESNSHAYTYEDIKQLPGFLLLSAMGYYDSSTDVIKRHMNMRLYNKELDLDKPSNNIMVYSNGYVRRIPETLTNWRGQAFPGTPRIMKKFDGENSLLRWQEQFLYIYDWTLKQYKKHSINSKYGIIDKSQFTNRDTIIDNMIENFPRNSATVYSIYDHLTEIERKKLLKGIKLTSDKFEENRGKYKMARGILNTWLK